MSPAALVLAAGSSSRLGRPKQLETLDPGSPHPERLLERAVRLAFEGGCDPVLVVLGADEARIKAACHLGAARCVHNPGWKGGMSTSLRAGLQLVPRSASGVVVLGCDQPAVTAQHLRQLWQKGIAIERPVASLYAGHRGVPAWFPAESFTAMSALSGDRGARELLRDLSTETLNLAGGELDVDTENALEAARAWFQQQRLSDPALQQR